MGSLTTCSLSRLRDFAHIPVKYFIVLKPGNVKVQGMRHRPDLAPSYDLFNWTQQHKHETDWFQHYTEVFRQDMVTRPGLKLAVDRLTEECRHQDVLIVCFCGDPQQCHRRLIAEELARRGIEVHIH